MPQVEPYVLLMSATIDPGEFRKLLIDGEASTRLEEYQHSLQFWLNYDDPALVGIVFCENSAADISVLQANIDCSQGSQPQTPVEWLSFNGNDRPEGLHYGYSELGLIDYALNNSELISQHRRFIKVTGRLVVKNLAEINSRISSAIRFAADAHRFPNSKNDLKFRLRTQFLLADAEFYREHLYNSRERMSAQCSFIEEHLMRELWPLRSQAEVLLRLPVEPQLVGTSASIGTNYERGLANLKTRFRSVMRRLLPFIWL